MEAINKMEIEKTMIQIQKVEIGQVYYTSWGYDQTNYDYVIVDCISPSGKTAICRRARCQDLGSSGQCNIQKPVKEGYGKSFRMQIEEYQGEPQLRGSYIFCGDEDEDGSKRLATMYLAKDEQVFWETDTMFGH
jgi:hypothetical protein